MILELPITIKIGRKNFALNLNIYRNTHYLTLNRMKVEFGSEVSELISTLPVFKWVNLTYTLYPKTRRLCDVSNICSIVDKFFCDALVNQGKLEDDNYQIVRQVTYKFGQVDKENPRVTVELEGDTYENHSFPERD